MSQPGSGGGGRRRPSGLGFLLPALVLLGAVVLAAAVWRGRQPVDALSRWQRAPDDVRAVLWPEPRALPDFALATQDGAPFGPGGLRGQWSFLFFGYLNCPDVCPLTLYALRDFRARLRQQDATAAGYRFVFVTVDPERDDRARIGSYLAHFDPEFIGVGGDGPELRRLADALAVRYAAVSGADGRVSFDHTSAVIVIDPAGRAVGALPPPHEPDRMVAAFLRLREYLEP